MESPCTNHTYPIKHLYKDRELLKRFLQHAGKPKEGKGKEEAKKGGTAGKDDDGFPDPEECLMIFGGSDAIHSKRQNKVCVNTGFWSILEDDRWTHMQEEECSANNASGRLNACAVGYSGRR